MSDFTRMIRRTLLTVDGLSAVDREWLGEWLYDYLGTRDDEVMAVRRLAEIVSAAKKHAAAAARPRPAPEGE